MGGTGSVEFVDARGRERAERIARACEDEARRIEVKYSRFRETSVVSEINRYAGRTPVAVDEETCFLVEASLDLVDLTGGRFDPTVGVLRRAWDFKRQVVPTDGEIASLLPLVGASAVSLRDGTVFLRRAGMELDLGGVGKEYAVDRVAALLVAEGVSCALVNFAGDVRTIGTRGDGQPWSIAVAHPREKGRALFPMSVRGSAGVATSGDYERGFVKDGVRHHHILDARTGRPSRGVASVTAIADTAFRAGRFSTAAFLLGPVEGVALLEGARGVEGVLVTEEGELLATTGMSRLAAFPPEAYPLLRAPAAASSSGRSSSRR